MAKLHNFDYGLRIRRKGFGYSNDVPRNWAKGDLVLSHMYNIFNISLPETEKIFVKSIGSVIPNLKNEKLREIAQGYVGQEAQHSKEHQRACKVLENQGYNVEKISKLLSAVGFRIPTKIFGTKFSVALAGAFEHVTLLLASKIIGDDLLENSNPEMRRLFEWHLAEEVEHRNAVHDVMTEVCPGYFYRFFGILVSAPILFLQSYIGTMSLLKQDGQAFNLSSQIKYVRHYLKYYPSLYEMFIHYMLKGYKPDQYINDELLEKVGKLLSQEDVKKLAS